MAGLSRWLSSAKGRLARPLAVSSAAAQGAAGLGMSRAVPPAAVLPEHEQEGEDLARLRRIVQHRHHDHFPLAGTDGSQTDGSHSSLHVGGSGSYRR
jgi:hypothetical protein